MALKTAKIRFFLLFGSILDSKRGNQKLQTDLKLFFFANYELLIIVRSYSAEKKSTKTSFNHLERRRYIKNKAAGPEVRMEKAFSRVAGKCTRYEEETKNRENRGRRGGGMCRRGGGERMMG